MTLSQGQAQSTALRIRLTPALGWVSADPYPPCAPEEVTWPARVPVSPFITTSLDHLGQAAVPCSLPHFS